MALFFLVLFNPKPYLHDKQCHFEAACVIYAYLSLIPDLLLLSLIFLSFFFLSAVIHFFVNVSLSPSMPFHLSLISIPKTSLDQKKIERTFQQNISLCIVLFEEAEMLSFVIHFKHRFGLLATSCVRISVHAVSYPPWDSVTS